MRMRTAAWILVAVAAIFAPLEVRADGPATPVLSGVRSWAAASGTRMVFDFTHPVMGSAHVRMFREDAQRAADYLEYQIRGRLVKARHSRSAGGMWAGRKILPGFMVDCR